MTLREKVIRRFAISTWPVWERLGFHISPNHFYWPLPDSRSLQNYDFNSHFENDGIDLNVEKMLNQLDRIGNYQAEYEKIHQRTGYSSNGDGAILYGMIRNTSVQNLIEVGAGHSTQIIHAALSRNAEDSNGQSAKVISVEPYPTQSLVSLVSQNPATISLVQTPVQSVPLSVFKSLRENDILFIDSSHVLAIGSDVHYLYLKVLPSLAPGVIIHIHDIRYPQDYPRDWVLEARKFWSEQYLLQAFMAFNKEFEIIFASNYLYRAYPELMKSTLVDLPSTLNGWPGSFWIRRLA